MKTKYLKICALTLLLSCQPISHKKSSQVHVYPKNEKTTFINSCSNNETPTFRTVCECAFQEIELTYGFDQYKVIAQDLRNGGALPGRFDTIINNCIDDPAPRELCVSKHDTHQYVLDPFEKLHVKGAGRDTQMTRKNKKSVLNGQEITVEYEAFIGSRRLFIYSISPSVSGVEYTKTFISHKLSSGITKTTELNCRSGAL